jgi:hypothetical protein
MNMRANAHRLVALAAVALLFASACGGGEDGNNGSNNDNSSTSNNTTSTNVTTPNSTTPNNSNPSGFDFRTEEPGDYVRVDAVGQPYVSRLFVPGSSKNGYNDQIPDTEAYDDAIVQRLSAWHAAVDDELINFALPPCSMDDTDADGLPDCLGQNISDDGAEPVTPAQLLRPDSLKILDAGADAGYPNGRTLADPVADILLGIVLIDQSGRVPPDIIVGVLNPPANDANDGDFSNEFPYLNDPF